MSKLAIHFQNAPPDWAKSGPASVNGPWVKMIDPPAVNPFPNSKVVGRVWIGGDQVEQQLIRAGDAYRYIELCDAAYKRAPYVHAWEGPNEPPVLMAQDRHQLNSFLVDWSRLMSNRKLLTVGGCLSVGWPNLVDDIYDLENAIECCDYWAVHEYGAPTMQTDKEWKCLRYRTHFLNPLSLGHNLHLLITECGIDAGAGQGWKAFTNLASYWEQLKWYDNEISKDPEAEAAFIFTASPAREWMSFEVTEELAKMIHDEHAKSPLPAPPTPPISVDDDLIRMTAWGKLGIPWVGEFALIEYATQHDLGAPLSKEFDVNGYRCQGYAKAIVFCPIGQWDKIEEIGW
jgi:hypothetical protein